MEIAFTKSFWEMDLAAEDDPIRAFVSRVAADGFDGTEMFLPLLTEEPERVEWLHSEYGLLSPIIDIITEGETPEEHRDSFDRALARAMEFAPRLVNSHTGRDIFTFAENVSLFRHATRRSDEAGVPVVHETHRFRPTYSAPETRRYLEEVPELMLNADLSHWMVVHESDLVDQQETIDLVLERSRHIHARVGFEEGPQVNDPREPEWAAHVARHIELWQGIADVCRRAGVERLSVTPEFGPPPYAPTAPGTGQAMRDVWEINVFMKDLLRAELH
jgi:sugar phosphate isomerase/epimerase